ncbi:hypothetical protein [Streptomyces sp. WG7]|uniref:hypothetical protein n=1 Tax=Streptomyces sp. WG7 TaxID=3417650 RepID=UPI003CEC85DA
MSSDGPGAGGTCEVGNVSGSGNGQIVIGTVGPYATFNRWLKHSALLTWPSLSVFLVIAWTIGYVVYAVAHWPGGPQTQYVWFYVLAPLALLIAGAAALYPADRTGETRDAEQQAADERRRGIVRAVLVGTALLCSFGGAFAWAVVDRTGEVGVEMSIGGTQPVGDAGGTLTVEMARPALDDVRDKLRLKLTIVDDDPSTPTCVGRTTATITAATPGVTPNTREVPAQSTVDFDLGGRQGALRFEVAVHPETGCSMRLAQARGTLHND